MRFDPFISSLLILLADWFGSRATVFLPVSKVEIGPTTTVVSGPLKPDGTIDYQAAYNGRAAAGIDPENNATVWIVRAIGSSSIPTEYRKQYFQHLKIDEPAPAGEFLVRQEAFAKRLVEKSQLLPDQTQELLNLMGTASANPWNRYELPNVAAWIQANEKPLQLLERASRCSQMYLPMVSTGTLEDAPLWLLQEVAQVGARLFLARAFLHISEGDYDLAVDDLLTRQRLSRLIGHLPIGLCPLIGYGMDSGTVSALQTLLGQPLTAEQIARYRPQFTELPPVMDMGHCYDFVERFIALEFAQQLWLDKCVIGKPNPYGRLSWVDVNEGLRRCNIYYDELIQTRKIIGFRERRQAIKAIQTALDKRIKGARNRRKGSSLWTSRTAATDQYAIMASGLTAPAADKLQVAEDRANVRYTLLKVGFALAAYRAQFGNFPPQLELLVPTFLEKLPVDQFTDGALHYETKAQSCRLYSVGEDEKDDGGQPYDSAGGDLTFEIPETPQFLGRLYQQERAREQLLHSLITWAVCLTVLTVWGLWRTYELFYMPRLKTGPATSVVTGPLKTDGTLDFEAALHQRVAANMTVENNATVLLDRAFGPLTMPSELRPRFTSYLGITEQPTVGDNLIDEQAYASERLKIADQSSEAIQALLDEMSRGLAAPWTRAELPRVAEWIDSNAEPLQLIEQASFRLALYMPLVSNGPLWKAPLPLLKPLATAGRLLASRALLNISEGRFDVAIKDLLVCHRLAGLLGHSSTADGILLATSIDALAIHCSQYLLSQPLTILQIKHYQSKLTALPELITNLAETLNNSTRLETLDGLQAAAHSPQLRRELLGFDRLSRLDLNTAFRRSNRYFDLVQLTLQEQGVKNRLEALDTFRSAGDRSLRRAARQLFFARRLVWSTRRSFSNAMTDVILRQIVPDISQLQLAADRAQQRRELLHAGLALAAYRTQLGVYPERWESLVPDYLSEAPRDYYAERPLHYQQFPTGYQLSSAGFGDTEESQLSFQVTHISRSVMKDGQSAVGF